eukprot:CAMPEP_0197889636 /NCGR_PEP_ID=MMETSP1439-20131203/24447_1 /TAXON_ID=66791 /ORGANISM="Gonyaulax spinifera, Strain CCMP409" /LENGTH=73 /DNA_ID=CAMNT_0043509621 /DNA_START=59 /DNA_END=276 /DNA_ORIENTATION=+
MPAHQAAAMRRREARRALALGALALVAGCLLSNAFVAPSPPAAGRGQSAVSLRATGEYTGFVPDMQRRMLMNL